ncbi:hypothetical protein GGF46_004259 [Coemansia sp. RSA 552]|nr:hypothetical protein GGF46_004259 [Coemansia sp. RSA 552]
MESRKSPPITVAPTQASWDSYGHRDEPPLSKRIHHWVILLRIIHTLLGLALVVCFGAMEAYMLLEQFHIVAIPLTVCRLVLASALVILVLCDWAAPKSIHRYFPMYSHKHSVKALGLSQLVVGLFALSDPSLVSMGNEKDDNAIAPVLLPLVIVFSSLVMVCGVVYFIVGAVGGARLRARMLIN